MGSENCGLCSIYGEACDATGVLLGKDAKTVPDAPVIHLRDPYSCFRACWLANGQYNAKSVSEFFGNAGIQCPGCHKAVSQRMCDMKSSG